MSAGIDFVMASLGARFTEPKMGDGSKVAWAAAGWEGRAWVVVVGAVLLAYRRN